MNNVSITITFDSIIKRAEMLSAFEAKQSVGANGESMFSNVRIYEKDYGAIKTYIKEAASIIEAMLAATFAIDASETALGIVWRIADTTSRRTAMTADKFTEAIVCHVLNRWMENKMPKAAESYAAMFKDMADAAVRVTKTKRKPARPNTSNG